MNLFVLQGTTSQIIVVLSELLFTVERLKCLVRLKANMCTILQIIM